MSVYAGKLLRVDLTRQAWHVEPIEDTAVRKWLMGSGLAAKVYYDEMDPALPPLAPDSPLIIMNGVLAGTFAPTGCRSSWCGRSPLTGIWNEANVGHHWGAELRAAGFDGLVITGRAEFPIYLWIDGSAGRLELRDARHLWGQEWFEAGAQLLAETDPKAQIAGIGTAAERLVKVAGVMVGPASYVRAAARGGMGALLASKHLKAIAVRGKDRPTYPDFARFRDEVKTQNAIIKEDALAMTLLGTAGGVPATERTGDLPLRNWTQGNWAEAINLAGKTFYPKYLIKSTHCFACPIGCGKEIEVKEGAYPSPRGEGVEFEALAGFGANCHISNVEAVALANSLCNRYGLDTISTSALVAFAMEAYERGIIGPQDTGGLELKFGSADAMLALVGKIARREDIGDLLAEGVREAARHMGRGAEAFALHVKGLEISYHDPRAFFSMAVNYATGVRGGCHLEAATFWNGYGVPHPDLGYPEPLPPHASNRATVKLCYDYQNYAGVYNPLGLCKFLVKSKVGPERLSAVVNSALGWNWTTADVLLTGDRLFQLKRLINLRLGVTAADDVLPMRLVAEPRPSGEAAGQLPNMDIMMPIYYELRGWDSAGRPTPERLEKLGLA